MSERQAERVRHVVAIVVMVKLWGSVSMPELRGVREA